ncbi:membrane insertion protein [Butyrivibrio proteoclasticus B316]|uniref:Membrane insertion protein n=1 Tax=Butyrivibrio proteoclasticus (strain ATCC 51982 / DSM 14932 / B316) TaxID=515622 RepID=E0RW06_BUTPB|nr:YidC/Oxa1 family membrane protein insertase [Butyrivibrio proteoclasticus]ADL35688.1 membrane insertion protein [Butyrivibrio proteoclasticus B316]
MIGVLLTKDTGKIVGPVAWLLGHVMNGIFNVLNTIGIPNIGLAIIIFTIVIYLCLLPLTYKQQKFSKLQAKMSPELKAIQDKYKGKKDNDSMLAMQAETKELYAKYGVSQTGSCLQLIIQMPILFALYRVISNIPAYVTIVRNAFYPLVEELRTADGAADFFQTLKSASQFTSRFSNEQFTSGNVEFVENTYIDILNKTSTADWASISEHFTNLSSSIDKTHSALNTFNSFLGLNIADSPMYMIQTAFANKNFLLFFGGVMVPVLAAFTQWVNTKLMPQNTDPNAKLDPNDPAAQMQQSMKTMNIMMPLMSAFFCLSLPAGMGVYWIAGAVIRSIQQIVINRHIDKTDIDAEIAKNTEKYKKKMEKMKSSPNMNMYANMSTRNLSSVARKETVTTEDVEKKVARSREIYEKNNIRKDSLLAKANMVKDYNENYTKE